MDIDVADCLRRWSDGDEGAAEEIIVYLYPVISRIARTHLSRRDQEEDLIQEILMKTFARLHQYRQEVPLSHWVSRIAVTTCLDRLRAHKVRPEVRSSDLSPEDTDFFEMLVADDRTRDAGSALEARDLVEKLLSLLEPEDRSLILMADLEGRSAEEIAAITGWGVSKIKMRLFRLRGQLRKSMQRWDQKK